MTKFYDVVATADVFMATYMASASAKEPYYLHFLPIATQWKQQLARAAHGACKPSNPFMTKIRIGTQSTFVRRLAAPNCAEAPP